MLNNFPEKLGEYFYINTVESGQGNCGKAVYKNNNSDIKVFVKFSSDLTILKKEYENQKTVFDTVSRNTNTDIIVPKPIKLHTEGKCNAFIMEYIEIDKPLYEYSSETCSNVFCKVLENLNNIDPNSHFNKISSKYQLLTVPYFFVRNTLAYPNKMVLFIKCLFAILRYSADWLKLKHQTFTHGDMNSNNIIINDKGVFIIDFRFSCISHRYYNLAQSLNSMWHIADFQKMLFLKITETFNLTIRETKILKSFVLFNLMQRMCKRYESVEHEVFNLDKMDVLCKEI